MSWCDTCSDGGLLIMGKAAQEKVRFRWYDMTRYEVSNKVGSARSLTKSACSSSCSLEAVLSVL